MPVTVLRTREDLLSYGKRRFFEELSHLGTLPEDVSSDTLERLNQALGREIIPLGGSLGREALFEALEDLEDHLTIMVQEEQKKVGLLSRTSFLDYLAEMYGDEVPRELYD